MSVILLQCTLFKQGSTDAFNCVVDFPKQVCFFFTSISRPGHYIIWTFESALHNYFILLLLLSRFSCVRLCETPQMAVHQAPLSLGFSRQEHWSGLPFPSPMHESEKWKWSRSVSVRLFVTPRTTAHQAPPSMEFPRQEYWNGLPLPSPKLWTTKQTCHLLPPHIILKARWSGTWI